MAKSTVPVNFKDDIMNSAMGGKRRYRMINNSDGTISLEDVTTYDQVGSTFGAAQMNATNNAVNAAADASKIIDDIDAIRALTQEGYMAGALALKQVDESLENFKWKKIGTVSGANSFSYDASKYSEIKIVSYGLIGNNVNPFQFEQCITTELLTSSKVCVYGNGGYLAANATVFSRYEASNKEIQITYLCLSGENAINNFTHHIYAR